MILRSPMLLIASALAAAAPPEDPSGLSDAAHRVAIVSWSSGGTRGKEDLKGAKGDAEAVGAVLQELGGVSSGDLHLLEAPDTSALLSALRSMRAGFRADSASGVQSVFVYYHAGHADPRGLDLGGQILPWARLREAVASTGARMRVAVVDACASGSVLRARGGRFAIPAPVPVRGEAWIVSSRAEESSIETDSDGGGIFTRILLGGLRGGADLDRDGLVTFEESFRHVSAGVRERARLLGVASQTPQWSSSLEGDRPLVLTRVDRGGSSALEIAARGRGILLSDSTGASEAWIPPDTASRRIVLPPGLHTAWMPEEGRRLAHRFRLEAGETRRIRPEEFMPVDLAGRATTSDTALRSVPVNFGLLSPLTLNGAHPEKARNAFSLDLVLGDAGAIRGFQMAGILNRVRREAKGAQIAGVMNLTQGSLTGFQLSAVNLLGGGATGFQAGALMNLDEGDSRGAHLASLMDVNRGSMTGAQVSLGSCYAGRLRGGQISLVNVSGSMTGAQVGVLNIARESRGLQAGLVNVALSSKGAAVGLVNVAPRSRMLAVGVVNVGRDLSVHPVVGVSHDGRDQLQIRYQTSWWRSLVLAEQPRASGYLDPEASRWGLGIGASTPGRVSLGLDALVLSDDLATLAPEPALQVGAEWRILPRFAPGVQLRWIPGGDQALSTLFHIAL